MSRVIFRVRVSLPDSRIRLDRRPAVLGFSLVAVLSISVAVGPVRADESISADAAHSAVARVAQPGSYCGVQSLYTAARSLGKDIRFADLVKPEYISSKRGSSVADLSIAGTDMGVVVEPVKRMTCGMLRQLEAPALLHVKSTMTSKDYDHWVLCMGTEAGKAKIYDGEQPATAIGFGELAARWDGNAVVVANSPGQTSGMKMNAVSGLVLFVGATVFVAGFLFCVERRWWPPRSSSTWFGSASRSVGQSGGLLLIATLTMAGFRFGTREGFLSETEAIATIQDFHFGSFLPKVRTAEVARLLEAPDVAFVDARTTNDYLKGHLKRAISIPVGSTQSDCRLALAELPRNHRIVVYSHSNGCSFGDQIAKELIALGYHNVLLFRGGWIEWTKQHAPERDV